jgi:hypothetical protein
MKTAFLRIVTCLLFPCLCFSQERKETISVQYKSGKYNLTNHQKLQLLQWWNDAAKSEEIKSISINGYSDSIGRKATNLILCKRRTNAVASYLADSLDMPLALIKQQPFGESNPTYSNATQKGRALNRRTDIIVELEPLVKTPGNVVLPLEETDKTDISNLYRKLAEPPQTFCIDVGQDTFLVGKKGTIIHYKANTIKFPDHQPCSCITIELNEYYDKDGLILNNLTTTSNGQPLESAGMIKLNGKCNGEQFDLSNGEYLTVMMPADNPQEGMKLFSANRLNQEDYLNWKLAPNDSSDLQVFDPHKWQWRDELGDGSRGGLPKCHFFFCKIRRFVQGIFGGGPKKDEENDMANNQLIGAEKNAFKDFTDKGSLGKAVALSESNLNKGALKYYVYKNYNWDYRNIDRYIVGYTFTTFIVKNKPYVHTDIKLIYKFSKSVVPANEKNDVYNFFSVLNHQEVWLVGLRYMNDEIYLALKEENTRKGSSVLEFNKVTLEELKDKLKVLN